jgi:hypothetical protein
LVSQFRFDKMENPMKTYEDDSPRDTVPWIVLGLPPLRRNHLTDRVTDEPHSVVRQLLGMSRGGRADPRKRKDEGGVTSELVTVKREEEPQTTIWERDQEDGGDNAGDVREGGDPCTSILYRKVY